MPSVKTSQEPSCCVCEVGGDVWFTGGRYSRVERKRVRELPFPAQRRCGFNSGDGS